MLNIIRRDLLKSAAAFAAQSAMWSALPSLAAARHAKGRRPPASFYTLLGAGGHGADQTYSGSYYGNVCLGRCAMFNIDPIFAESEVWQTVHLDGSISYLAWGLDSPAQLDGYTLTFVLRSGTGGHQQNTPLAVSFDDSAGGFKVDTSDTAQILAGDQIDFAAQVSEGSGFSYTGNFYCASARFESFGEPAQLIGCVGPTRPVTADHTPYPISFLGCAPFVGGAESIEQIYALVDGTWSNMACTIEFWPNNQTPKGTATIQNRIDTGSGPGNGSMAISFAPDESGYKEDTSDSDQISAGDLMNYRLQLDSGQLGFDWVGAQFVPKIAGQCIIGGCEAGEAELTKGSPYYSSLFGAGNIANDINRATGMFPYSATASDYTVNITASSAPGIFTVFAPNGAEMLAVSCAVGQSGYLMDNASVAVNEFETCTNQAIVEATESGQSITWASSSLLLTAN